MVAGPDTALRGSRLGSKMAVLKSAGVFASFAGRENSRFEPDPFSSDSRLIDEGGGVQVAIGDAEPGATTFTKRGKGKAASGSMKSFQESGSLGTGTVLRGFRDALRDRLDTQLESREVKHNTRVNRSKYNVQDLLKEMALLDAEEVTPKNEGLSKSFTFSFNALPETRPKQGTRFVETVQIRTVNDNGTQITYAESEMAIDYTSRKHVLTFEAHNVGEVNDCDLLV